MEWVRAKTVAEALSQAGPHSRFVGGGLSLTLLMERGIDRPERLIDLSALPLRTIEGRPGELRLGSQVRLAALLQDPMVQSLAPLVRTIAGQIATPAIRNQATLGGELLERTRCPLFRDPSNVRCGKRLPGSGCAVLEGATYAGAIFGASAACVASSASELAVGLAAMSAQVTIHSPEGVTERVLPMLELYAEPGLHPERDHVLGPTELLMSVTVPVQPQRQFGYARLAESPLSPMASAAVMLEQREQRIAEARIILGGLAVKPWRVIASEQILTGQIPTEALFDKAAEAVLAGSKARSDSRHLPALAKQVAREALRRAVEEHAAHRR